MKIIVKRIGIILGIVIVFAPPIFLAVLTLQSLRDTRITDNLTTRVISLDSDLRATSRSLYFQTQALTATNITVDNVEEMVLAENEALDDYDDHRKKLKKTQMRMLSSTDNEWNAFEIQFKRLTEHMRTRTKENLELTHTIMIDYTKRYDDYKSSLHRAGRTTRNALVIGAILELTIIAFFIILIALALILVIREGKTSKDISESTKALIDNLGVPAFIIDNADIILDVSTAALRAFGYESKDKVIGLEMYQLIPSTYKGKDQVNSSVHSLFLSKQENSKRQLVDEDKVLSKISSNNKLSRVACEDGNESIKNESLYMSNDQQEKQYIQGIAKDGRLLDLVHTLTSTVHNGKRTTTIVCQDITELLSKDRDLQVAQKVLRQFAHELRSKYACAAHELETVRACIKRQLALGNDSIKKEFAKVGVDDGSLAAAMCLLHEADQLIETRLQLHKVYRGVYKTEPNIQIVEQAALLASRVDVARALASSSSKVQYIVDTSNKLSDTSIELDCYVFEHIANNLLSNARKHTSSGCVSLSFLGINKDQAKNKTQQLLFAVKDTGRGIPDEIKSRLFKEEVTSADIRGIGLGLLSCKVFAEAIGGSCWVQSTKTYEAGTTGTQDCGTEFRFCLPGSIVTIDTPQPRHSIIDIHDTQLPKRLRIFVVEDSGMLRRTIVSKLKSVANGAGCSEIEINEHETVESIIRVFDTFIDDPNAIVTTDQNLESMGGHLNGSDLIIALKKAKYKGLLVSCTGDMQMGQSHMDLGADLVWGKPLPNYDSVLISLQKFYATRNV